MPIWAIVCLSIVGFFLYLLIGSILAKFLDDGDGWDYGIITVLWPLAIPIGFVMFVVILIAEDIVIKIRGY